MKWKTSLEEILEARSPCSQVNLEHEMLYYCVARAMHGPHNTKGRSDGLEVSLTTGDTPSHRHKMILSRVAPISKATGFASLVALK